MFSAAFFIFFAALAGAITFGGLMSEWWGRRRPNLPRRTMLLQLESAALYTIHARPKKYNSFLGRSVFE